MSGMDKKTQIQKNILDLNYHRQTQLLNAVVILGTTGLLSFLGTFIWKRDLLLQGTLIAAVIVAVCLLAYRTVNATMKNILREMEKLKQTEA